MPPKRKPNASTGKPPKKRKSITMEVKLDIVKRHEKGATATQLGRLLKLNRTTVATIIRDKERILEHVKRSAHMKSTSIRKQRGGLILETERLLVIWLEEMYRRRMRVSHVLLQAKARSVFEDLKKKNREGSERETFVASTGWLNRFKIRSNLHDLTMRPGGTPNAEEKADSEIPSALAHVKIERCDSDDETELSRKRATRIKDASTSQNYLNPSSSSPNINSYNLNAQNSEIDTKPITVNHADIKKQQLEFLEAQMHQADVEAKKRQAEAKKRQAELAEAKKLAEKLAEEERLRKEAENKVYKYMVLNHEKKVLETLRALWKGNQFCDATLQNEFISIPVHKIVLIACCPKILETYDYIMKDTNVQVCFPRKVTAEALKAFVDYLYNGSLNLSRAILDSMEYLSGMLGLDDIRQLCNQFRSDMINDSFCLPDKTIVHVNNPHEHPSHQMSYNDHIIAPPPIVRPSTHNVAAPTAVSIQLSNFQDVTPVTSVHSNNFNLFSEPHADSVLTEVSHIKLEPEPEVDLTAEDCTEIKQESLQSQLYGDANCKFDEWPSTVVEPHHPPPSSSLSQPNFIQRNKNNNFEMSTVDLSLAPLNTFQKQTSNNISTNISSSGVITISPSNSPCPSPRLTESPSDVQTLQISNTHTISTTTANPFPVSLISTNGQSISLTDQDNKRKHFADYDSKDDRKRSKIILN